MKIHGNTIPDTQEEIVVIPRGSERLIFKARLVKKQEHDLFDELCPEPEVPKRNYTDGRKNVPDYENAKYKEQLQEYNKKNNAYVILKSLAATEGLEWDAVDMGDCETWANYREELTDNGFSNTEVSALMDIVIAANGMSDRRIQEATSSFLAEQRLLASEKSSPTDEQ